MYVHLLCVTEINYKMHGAAINIILWLILYITYIL